MHLTPIRRVGKTCEKTGRDSVIAITFSYRLTHATPSFYVRHMTRVTVAARALRQCGRTATDGPFAG